MFLIIKFKYFKQIRIFELIQGVKFLFSPLCLVSLVSIFKGVKGKQILQLIGAEIRT
jgi:hypothetical protein